MEERKPLGERKPSAKLEKILKPLEIEASKYFTNPTKENKISSINKYKEMLNIIFKYQEIESRPIHKGLPYHNLGVIFFSEKKHNDALKNYILAYIEDALNFPSGSEDFADTYPAYYNLNNVFVFSSDILNKIKQIAKKYKDIGKKIYNPENIFAELNLPTNLLVLTNVNKLVFIGGDYLVNSENITIIKKYVEKFDYTPMIAFYVFQNPNDPSKSILPDDRIYEESIKLLKRCKYAIFTVCHGGGHYFEISKCNDFKIDPLLLIHKFLGEGDKLEKISGMVRTIGFDIQQYTDPFTELKKIIRDYLPRI